MFRIFRLPEQLLYRLLLLQNTICLLATIPAKIQQLLLQKQEQAYKTIVHCVLQVPDNLIAVFLNAQTSLSTLQLQHRQKLLNVNMIVVLFLDYSYLPSNKSFNFCNTLCILTRSAPSLIPKMFAISFPSKS